MAELKRDAPHVEQGTAGDGYSFTLRSRLRAKSVREVIRGAK